MKVKLNLAFSLLLASVLACSSLGEPTAPNQKAEQTTLRFDSARFVDLEYEEALEDPMEWQVIRNMHKFQRAFEQFAELNAGQYPTSASDATIDGRNLRALFPDETYPINPYLESPTRFSWGSLPNADPGQIAATTAEADRYEIRARSGDPRVLLELVLTNDPN